MNKSIATFALAVTAAGICSQIRAETPAALFESYLRDLPDCEIRFTKSVDPAVSQTLKSIGEEKENDSEPNPFWTTYEEISQILSFTGVFRKQGSRFLIQRHGARVSASLAFDGKTYYQRSAHRKMVRSPWRSKLVIADDLSRLSSTSGILREIPLLLPFLSILSLNDEQVRLIEACGVSPRVAEIYTHSPLTGIEIHPEVEIQLTKDRKLIWGKDGFPTFFEKDNGERGIYRWAVLKSASIAESSDFVIPTVIRLESFYGKPRRLGVDSYTLTVDSMNTKLLTDTLPERKFRIPKRSAEMITNYKLPLDKRISVTPIFDKTTWSSKDGKTIEATVFRVLDSHAYFFLSGKEVVYPISQLSEEDQELLKIPPRPAE